MSALPMIGEAPLPALYEQAQHALAQCSRIDECQAWANKAEALASYARQSRDETLRRLADRIQARAIRRCGELLRLVEPARGGDRRSNDQRDGAVPLVSRAQAAADAGLSERQRKTALRVAAVPAAEFERAVESEAPPTITALARAGTQARPLVDLGGTDPAVYARATEAQGTLRRFAEYCERNDATAIAAAFRPHEIAALRRYVSTVDGWLDRFVINLPE